MGKPPPVVPRLSLEQLNPNPVYNKPCSPEGPGGLSREDTTETVTTTGRFRDPAQLEVLVKEFLRKARPGIRVELVEGSTGLRSQAIFKIDEDCENFELKLMYGQLVSFGRGDILAIFKGAELKRRLPSVTLAAPYCVAMLLTGDHPNSQLIFTFATAAERSDFYVCLRILKMLSDVKDQCSSGSGATTHFGDPPTPPAEPRAWAGKATSSSSSDYEDFFLTVEDDEPRRAARGMHGSMHTAIRVPAPPPAVDCL